MLEGILRSLGGGRVLTIPEEVTVHGEAGGSVRDVQRPTTG
jgi:hypothetical protein